jgi:hypothetical protein
MKTNTNTKVKNEKHIAILGTPYTADTMGGKHTYNIGHKANVRGMFERGGEYIVEGHGIGHVIPRANFTKFIHTWDEVTTTEENGAKVVKTTTHEVDITADILKWWADRDAKKTKTENAFKRNVLRNKVATLRKAIADVKTGKAEKELANLLAEIEALK